MYTVEIDLPWLIAICLFILALGLFWGMSLERHDWILTAKYGVGNTKKNGVWYTLMPSALFHRDYKLKTPGEGYDESRSKRA